MPNIRRREPGRDQFGHHWENAGEAIHLPEDQASQLLAEPALPMYSLIEPGATKEVSSGDAAEVDADSPAGEHERSVAIGKRPDDDRLSTPDDNRPDSPNTPGSGKSDTLNAPGGTAAASDRSDVPSGKQADTRSTAPNDVDKTGGPAGGKGKVVGASDSKSSK